MTAFRMQERKMKQMIYDTVIIGAGASGLMAAVTAARCGSSVLLLEHMEQAAKKILVTGNGRCNYTNADQSLENYYCEEPDFVKTVLAQFSYPDTIRFFEELGIRPLQKNGTCIYPESEQAASVKSVLLAEVRRLGIPLVVSAGIRSVHNRISPGSDGARRQRLFEIQTKDQKFYSHTCLLATGGKAAKKTGSDGSGYLYARQLGHQLRPPLPGLAALLASQTGVRLPAGVRIFCEASLYIEGKQSARERGELQLTDYGISGIVIFQLSRIAAGALEQKKQVSVCLDFKPDMSSDGLAAYLAGRFSSIYHRHQTLCDGLTGFLPDRLIPVLLKQAGLKKEALCGSIQKKQLHRLVCCLKHYEVRITGSRGFDAAQVTAGGIPVQEIHAKRMESKKVHGLFFAGEIVDVDGKCGGYNLQWAWSSGYTAGKGIHAFCERKGVHRV